MTAVCQIHVSNLKNPCTIPTKAWLGYHWCQLPRSMSRCWIIWYWISNGRGYHLEAQLKVVGWMATWLPARWKVDSLHVFFVFLLISSVQELWKNVYIYIYIYTHNLICHREQSKWSKDLCISAVAVVVSLIISMCFFIFSWSDGLDLEIPPKPIESAQIHWVTKVFDQ